MVAPLKASLCFVTPEGDRWRRRGLGTHASYTTNYTTNTKKAGVETRSFLFGFTLHHQTPFQLAHLHLQFDA